MVCNVFGEGYHSKAGVGVLVATNYSLVMVADGAIDLCEGYHASGIAHCDDRE